MKNKKSSTSSIPLSNLPKSDFLNFAQWFIANESWLNHSSNIALTVLRFIRENNISQKVLAQKLNVSPQRLSVILQGRENLTLETISKLESALGIKLINITSSSEIMSASFSPDSNFIYSTSIFSKSIEKVDDDNIENSICTIYSLSA